MPSRVYRLSLDLSQLSLRIFGRKFPTLPFACYSSRGSDDRGHLAYILLWSRRSFVVSRGPAPEVQDGEVQDGRKVRMPSLQRERITATAVKL